MSIDFKMLKVKAPIINFPGTQRWTLAIGLVYLPNSIDSKIYIIAPTRTIFTKFPKAKIVRHHLNAFNLTQLQSHNPCTDLSCILSLSLL